MIFYIYFLTLLVQTVAVVILQRPNYLKKYRKCKLKHANSILESSGIFLPNIIKVDPYNFKLYRFKIESFFGDTVYLLGIHTET